MIDSISRLGEVTIVYNETVIVWESIGEIENILDTAMNYTDVKFIQNSDEDE